MRSLFSLFVAVLLCLTVSAKGASEDPISVLLLGTDDFVLSVTGKEEVSRADVILVLSAGGTAGTLKLLNIERDYLVDLPEGHGFNKLCTATYFGGPQMGLDAVNALFGLELSLYVQVDIDSAISIIDLFGGIQVEIFEDELDVILYPPFDNDYVFDHAGVHTLSGYEALAVIRSRDHRIDVIESNRGRNERQLRVLNACMDLFNRMEPGEKLDFISSVLPLIRTNISLGELLPLALTALGSDINQLEYRRSPESSYQTKTVNMHRVIVVDNIEEEAAAVRAFLYD